MKTTGTWKIVAAAGALLIGLSGATLAQERAVAIEVRGGVNVPTFDVADVAKAGPSVGVGLTVPLARGFSFIADADFGFHGGEEVAGVEGQDVNVYHYIAKVGFDVLDGSRGPWLVRLNAGVGAMTFDIDGSDSFTYPAINVGAKVAYAVTPRLHLFLNPQGDIAFSDEDELGTDNAWVWPFAVGIQGRF